MTAQRRRGPLDRVILGILGLGVVRGTRGWLRDRLWSWRGRRWTRPALPAGVRSMLFICKGNICRSPFAAGLAAQRLAGRGRPGIACPSAGYAPSQASRSPDEAVAAAARYGVALEDHRPSGLSTERVAASEIAVVFEVEHLERLRAAYPEHRDRFVLLPLFGRTTAREGYARYNLADPFGRPQAVFDACYVEIADAIDDLIDRLPSG